MANILIVDDSATIRKISRRILERMMHAIAEAEDGASALALCERHMPDVVVLDAHMPQMDGYEVLRQLRQMPGGERPKVLLQMAEHDAAQIARANYLGADEIIQKPFDREALLEKLAEMEAAA